MRMLKCPSCKRKNAWITYGTKHYDNGTHRHFKQKHCNCGFEGKRTYRNYQIDTECVLCKLHTEL